MERKVEYLNYWKEVTGLSYMQLYMEVQREKNQQQSLESEEVRWLACAIWEAVGGYKITEVLDEPKGRLKKGVHPLSFQSRTMQAWNKVQTLQSTPVYWIDTVGEEWKRTESEQLAMEYESYHISKKLSPTGQRQIQRYGGVVGFHASIYTIKNMPLISELLKNLGIKGGKLAMLLYYYILLAEEYRRPEIYVGMYTDLEMFTDIENKDILERWQRTYTFVTGYKYSKSNIHRVGVGCYTIWKRKREGVCNAPVVLEDVATGLYALVGNDNNRETLAEWVKQKRGHSCFWYLPFSQNPLVYTRCMEVHSVRGNADIEVNAYNFYHSVVYYTVAKLFKVEVSDVSGTYKLQVLSPIDKKKGYYSWLYTCIVYFLYTSGVQDIILQSEKKEEILEYLKSRCKEILIYACKDAVELHLYVQKAKRMGVNKKEIMYLGTTDVLRDTVEFQEKLNKIEEYIKRGIHKFGIIEKKPNSTTGIINKENNGGL